MIWFFEYLFIYKFRDLIQNHFQSKFSWYNTITLDTLDCLKQTLIEIFFPKFCQDTFKFVEINDMIDNDLINDILI